MKYYGTVFLLSLVVYTGTADCEGDHCCYNGDCGGGKPFCGGGQGVFCKCKSEWFAGMHGYGVCRALIPDGEWAYHGDYQSCQHKEGNCGRCGSSNYNGLPCTTPYQCLSEYCKDDHGSWFCQGTCMYKFDDDIPFSLVPGATCLDSQEPLTSSWQDCRDAAISLGFGGDAINHVDYYVDRGTSRPQGCYQSTGNNRFHFNHGAGGNFKGNDKILCRVSASKAPEAAVTG